MTRLDHEQAWLAHSTALIAGLDEAGRGALAGPVAAGAVVLPLDRVDLLDVLDPVRDSKRCTAKQRTELAALVQHVAVSGAVGMATAAEIDRIGIVPATRLAMLRALRRLHCTPTVFITDWVTFQFDGNHERLKGGEDLSLSVAAASILAKVARDRYMVERVDALYPAYQFAENKGYGTPAHRAAIQTEGPCAVHRYTFAPIRDMHAGGRA